MCHPRSIWIGAVVMSKTKGQTFCYRFGNKTKTFWYRSRICLVENRLFWFGPESALLDQIEMCSFDGADSGTNSYVLVSFLLDVGPRLILYCFDIELTAQGGYWRTILTNFQITQPCSSTVTHLYQKRRLRKKCREDTAWEGGGGGCLL